MDHAHKTVTVLGVVSELRAMGEFETVLRRVAPTTRAALESPHGARLHSGVLLDDAFTVLAELRGPEAVERIMYKVTEHSLSGIVGPLARLFTTVMGGAPAIFKRFDTLASAGTSGYRITWAPESSTRGLMTIVTDSLPAPIADHAWKGVLDFVLAFAQLSGRVQILERGAQGHATRLLLDWSAQP